MRLKEMASRFTMAGHESLPQIKVLVSALEKQRTAICGQKRMNLRVNGWWKELLASREMEQLWKTWVARMGDNMEQSMTEMDTILRILPNDLYAFPHLGHLYPNISDAEPLPQLVCQCSFLPSHKCRGLPIFVQIAFLLKLD